MNLKLQYLDNYKESWGLIFRDEGNAGFDLRTAIEDKFVLFPHQSTLIKLGVKSEFDVDYEVQIRPRSGLALKHGITVLNTPGTIDSNYRGEWGVILLNTGNEPFVIEPGMRICQGVVCRVPSVEFVVVNDVNETSRGESGYGASGVN